MNKLLITLTSLIATTNIFATALNLNQLNYSCNGTKLDNNITIAIITANCKKVSQIDDKQITSGHNAGDLRGSDRIDEDDNNPTVANLEKVYFTVDNGNQLKCYFRNNKLNKCVIKKIASNNKIASS